MAVSTREQWVWLRSIFPVVETLTITDTPLGNGLVVSEFYKGFSVFRYTRYFDGSRITHVNLLGFVGLSLAKSRRCILTEGVSDFLSVFSHANPDLFSVVGRTSVRLSAVHADMLAALFDEVVIISDNDYTGLQVFNLHFSLLSERGVRVRMVVPVRKDITLDLMNGDLSVLLGL